MGEAHVVSVNVGQPQPWNPTKHHTGIRKKPVTAIDVTEPGAIEDGGRSGVRGDFVGDPKHHGGSEKAVFLVSREELDYWQKELRRTLPDGAFGENVTTMGIDLEAAVIGTRWKLGTAVLQASWPRIPCRTFAWAMQEEGWLGRFVHHGRSGTYASVLTPGTIRPGDLIETLDVPAHDVTILDAFRAYYGDREALAKAVEPRVLSPRRQGELERKLRPH